MSYPTPSLVSHRAHASYRASFITLGPAHRRFIKNSRSCGVQGTLLLLRSSARPTRVPLTGTISSCASLPCLPPSAVVGQKEVIRIECHIYLSPCWKGSFLTSERGPSLAFCLCGPRASYLFVSVSLHSWTKFRFHVRVRGLDPVLLGQTFPSD